jgi:hypothetical protein
MSVSAMFFVRLKRNDLFRRPTSFRLIDLLCYSATFSNIMATSFSGGRSFEQVKGNSLII